MSYFYLIEKVKYLGFFYSAKKQTPPKCNLFSYFKLFYFKFFLLNIFIFLKKVKILIFLLNTKINFLKQPK